MNKRRRLYSSNRECEYRHSNGLFELASSRRGIAFVDLCGSQASVIAKDHFSRRGQTDKPRRHSMDDSEVVECHVQPRLHRVAESKAPGITHF
ncbi:hypothetical protein HN011_010365 [Eciton burchellii]|nr:hypothetical protein HN011_010365 [Eciton burchellii]